MSAESDGYLFHRALSSLRTAGSDKADGWSSIRAFWEALAVGGVDELEAARWAQEIAQRVVRDVFGADAKERPRKALASLGLVGVEGTHQEEREHIQMYEEFGELVEAGKRDRRPTRRQLAQQMLKRGYFSGLTEAQAMDAIEYIQNPPKR